MSEDSVTEIKPMKVQPHPADAGGTQRLYRFDNGYGASVVRFEVGTLDSLASLRAIAGQASTPGSYGHEVGLWELAVIQWEGDDFHLIYDTPITDDVIGWLDEPEVQALLGRIRDLPAVV